MQREQGWLKAPLLGRSVLLPEGLILRENREGAVDVIAVVSEKENAVPEKEARIVCILCGVDITSTRERIEINGSHTHTFLNPAGIVFRIGCFAHAPGCIVYGEGISEYSWFTDYLWSYATCSGCNNHLGWYYSAGGSSFFGLIMDQLAEGIL